MLGEFVVMSLKALGALFGGCGVFLLYMSWYNEKFLIEATLYLGLAAVIAVATNRKDRQRIRRR
jgi:hypothetical protein